jgi:ribosome maturation factor RimP
MRDDSLARDLEAWVEELGYELVDLEQAGTAQRPILRLRIDRPDAPPGGGVSLDDCARVSRALESHLDARPGLSERYVLEVSSPGVERPLVRRRDWERFAGQEVAVRLAQPLEGRGRRLEGTLLGLVSGEVGDEEERVALRLGDGEEVEVPLAEVENAHLVFRWGKQGRSG